MNNWAGNIQTWSRSRTSHAKSLLQDSAGKNRYYALWCRVWAEGIGTTTAETWTEVDTQGTDSDVMKGMSEEKYIVPREASHDWQTCTKIDSIGSTQGRICADPLCSMLWSWVCRTDILTCLSRKLNRKQWILSGQAMDMQWLMLPIPSLIKQFELARRVPRCHHNTGCRAEN